MSPAISAQRWSSDGSLDRSNVRAKKSSSASRPDQLKLDMRNSSKMLRRVGSVMRLVIDPLRTIGQGHRLGQHGGVHQHRAPFGCAGIGSFGTEGNDGNFPLRNVLDRMVEDATQNVETLALQVLHIAQDIGVELAKADLFIARVETGVGAQKCTEIEPFDQSENIVA